MTKLAETVEIQKGCIAKHPDADRLDVIDVYGDGRTFALVKRGDFVEGELAVFVPAIADPMVNTVDPRFAFLASDAKADGYARIKVRKLRGVESRGLLIKLDQELAGTLPEFTVDLDVSEALGIKKYDPDDYIPQRSHGEGNNPRGPRENAKGPEHLIPGTYDLEGVGKYHRLLVPDEEVVLTEKIHGANASYFWDNGALHARSRNLWKPRIVGEGEFQMESTGWWWTAARNAGIEEAFTAHPEYQHLALYGEVYGHVQDLKYGLRSQHFILFDVWDTTARQWLSFDERMAVAAAMGLRTVPVLYQGPWKTIATEATDDDGNVEVRHKLHPEMCAFAEGESVEAKSNGGSNVREGFVVEPIEPRNDRRLGRVKLKWVGTGYAQRKGG